MDEVQMEESLQITRITTKEGEKSMKNGTATEPGNLPVKLLKHDQDIVRKALADI